MVETRLSNTQLTKIITIFPMFVIVNTLPYSIMYKEGAAGLIDQVHHTAQEDGLDDTDALVIPAVTIQTSTLWTMVEPGEVRWKWSHRYHSHFETQLYEIAIYFVISNQPFTCKEWNLHRWWGSPRLAFQ